MSVKTENERKFLVRFMPPIAAHGRMAGDRAGEPAAVLLRRTPMRQIYIGRGARASVRVRQTDDRYILTLKGPTRGAGRREFEYDLPPEEGAAMMTSLGDRPPIEKERLVFEENGLVWELDVFGGLNDGLLLAELELPEGEAGPPADRLPDWVGPEVTHDRRFYNSFLFERPFATWGTDYAALLAATAAEAAQPRRSRTSAHSRA